MREVRRQKALDLIDKLEKALRNVGLLGAEIKMVDGYTWEGTPIGVEEGTLECVNIGVNDFLHALYHTIKKRDVEE